MTVSQWADKYRRIPAESSPEPGHWRTDRVPYLREIMDAASEPTVERIVFKKASQVAASEAMINVLGYYIDHDPSPMLMFQPRDQDAEDFSKDRIAPTIRDTPALREKVSDPKSRDSGNTILHKNFPGGKLVIGSAQSPAGLSSHPVRIVFFDEVDRYERSAGTEGDPIDLGTTRTRNFWNRKIFMASSPKTKLLSRIEPAFLESDQRYFYVPCKHCDHEFRIVFECLKWEEGKPKSARIVCPVCSCKMNTHERDQAVVNGKWKASLPFNGTAGFHISALYSPWVSLAQIAEMWEKSRDVPERRQVFVNTVLGEVFEETSDEFDWSVLMQRAEDYPATCPSGVLCLTAGVDVQTDRLECEIVGWIDCEESWNIDYHVINGDPDILPGQRDSPWDELLSIIRERSYQHELGYTLRVYATCIDSGGKNTDSVYAFCKGRRAQRIFAIKGVSGEDKPVAGTPNRKKTGKSKRPVDLYPVGVDNAKSQLYRRFKVDMPGRAGYCHFPRARDEDYFKQITSEAAITRYVKGFAKREWTLPSGQRNEALDCRVYATAAVAIARPPWDRMIKFRQEAVSAQRKSPELDPEMQPNSAKTPLGPAEEKPETSLAQTAKTAPVRRPRRTNYSITSW